MVSLYVESKSHSSILLIPKLHKSIYIVRSVIGNSKAKEPALQRDCSSFLPHYLHFREGADENHKIC